MNAYSTVTAIQLHQSDSTRYLPYSPPAKLLSRLRWSVDGRKGVLRNAYIQLGITHFFKQDKIYFKYGNETLTPGYTLLNAGVGTDIFLGGHSVVSLYLYGENLTDVAYQSNMSRLKYADTNKATGRVGVFAMGRNFSFKMLIPLYINKHR